MAAITFTLLTILLISTPLISSSATTTHHHHRRILHQPFFPQITQAPIQPPQPQPQQQKHQEPKYPFSSFSPPDTPKNPFFPFYSSPPPPKPPSTAQATFPANISSLVLPQTSHSSKPISKKLVAVAVSLSLLAAALVTAVAAFLLHHRRHGSFTSTTHHNSKSDKTPKTDSIRLFPPNTATSDSDGDGGRKLPRLPSRSVSAASSTEFLYLGTLTGINEDTIHKKYSSDSTNAVSNSSMMPAYEKLGSPELRPLPPLPRLQIFRRSFSNQENGVNQENEEEEEFFSPRSSSGRKESPKRLFLEGNSRSASNHSCPSSSNSASPSNNSMSSSPFIPLNLIPTSLKAKAVDFYPAPSRPPPPIPKQTFAENTQNTPVSDSSEGSGDTHNTPTRDYSNVVRTVQGKLPPTPPPLPPPRFWEARDGPPVLVTPTRSVAFRDLEVGEGGGGDLGSVERGEETVKPKLKALHWDKVRASSDRAMVWDHLKSSSFQ